MPLAGKNNLAELYANQRLLLDEAARLELQYEALGASDAAGDRRYVLDVEIRALREEATRLDSSVSDILERDLQR